MRVSPLDWEDPLKEEKATYSSILAWKIPWTEEPGGYSPWGCKESDTTEHTYLPWYVFPLSPILCLTHIIC